MATKYWIATTAGSFSTAANWSTGTAPASGDTLIFNALGPASVTSGLNASALTGLTIIIDKSYPGSIGTSPANGATPEYLQIGGGTLIVGRETGGTSSGTGQPLLMVDFGATSATATIYDSASSATVSSLPPILLKGGSLTVHHCGGRIGVAALPGDTSTITYRCGGQVGSVSAAAYFGAGATVTDIDMQAGTVTSAADGTVTAVTVGGGTYVHQGSGAHTTITTAGNGVVYYDGTGTITTLNNSGTFYRTRGTAALTITTTNLYSGCTLDLDNGLSSSVTRTTVNLHGRLQDMNVRLPYGEKL